MSIKFCKFCQSPIYRGIVGLLEDMGGIFYPISSHRHCLRRVRKHGFQGRRVEYLK